MPQRPDSRLGVSDKGKTRELDNASKPGGTKSLDFLRVEQNERAEQGEKVKATLLPPDLTTGPLEGRSSEVNEPQTGSTSIGSSAWALLREIKAQEAHDSKEMRQRLTRITGDPEFLENNPKHTEVVKIQNAISKKRQAYQRGHLPDFYSAHKDLLAAEAKLTQETDMMRSLENGLKGLEYVEGRLSSNDHTLRNDTVIESINDLTKNLSDIQKKHDATITQWEKAIDNIERCVVELKRLVPDLPLPDLDKALTFPQGKIKEKDEPSDKAEKEAKRSEIPTAASSKLGDQPSSSGDQAESVAKATISNALEQSEDAKKLYEEFEGHLSNAHSLRRKLTNLDSQWDKFVDKRKSQMDQLKTSQDLQSKRVGEAMSAMAAGSDKGKSDIAAAMKYVTRLVGLTAVAIGGSDLRMKM